MTTYRIILYIIILWILLHQTFQNCPHVRHAAFHQGIRRLVKTSSPPYLLYTEEFYWKVELQLTIGWGNCFCHCLPIILLHGAGFLNHWDLHSLGAAIPLVGTLATLIEKYRNVDISDVKGFGLYKNFANETDFNEDRIKQHTAILLRARFLVPTLVQNIEGTHIGAHRDVKKIQKTLTPSVDPTLLDNVCTLFTRDCGFIWQLLDIQLIILFHSVNIMWWRASGGAVLLFLNSLRFYKVIISHCNFFLPDKLMIINYLASIRWQDHEVSCVQIMSLSKPVDKLRDSRGITS